MLTVVTPRAEIKLVSLDAFKAEVGIADTVSDDFLSGMLDRVSQVVEGYCDRVFAVETVTEDIRLCGPDYVRLSRYPVTTISALLIDGEEIQGDLGEAVEVVPDTGHLYRLDANGAHVPWSESRLQITYTGGYATIPGDLQEAILRLAKLGSAARSRDPSLKSENILSGLYSYQLFDVSAKDAVPSDVAGLLSRYIRYSI